MLQKILFSVRFVLTASAVIAGLPAAAAANPNSAPDACMAVAAELEVEYRMPRGLLQAIALVESGRWNSADKSGSPWPWTITAGSHGKFFDSRSEAVDAAAKLKAKGENSFDVGCMQINMHYHPAAFASLDEAFEPELNVRYAADFLNDLRKRERSWGQAVKFYHSSNPERQKYYHRKVFDTLRSVRIKAARQRAKEQRAKTVYRGNAADSLRSGTAANANQFSTQPRTYQRQRMMQFKARATALQRLPDN